MQDSIAWPRATDGSAETDARDTGLFMPGRLPWSAADLPWEAHLSAATEGIAGTQFPETRNQERAAYLWQPVKPIVTIENVPAEPNARPLQIRTLES